MATTMVSTGNEFTVKNLLVAYAGEANAEARYKEYADKADEEGFRGVAALFRAAARAEQIHARNQARVLRQMGGEPRADIAPFKVRSTLDNLKSALAGERYEIGAMYPPFIEEATAHMNSNAARTFMWALEAEKSHERLYSEAVAIVESGEAGSWIFSDREYRICPVCAYTAETNEAQNCPICSYPWEMFESVR